MEASQPVKSSTSSSEAGSGLVKGKELESSPPVVPEGGVPGEHRAHQSWPMEVKEKAAVLRLQGVEYAAIGRALNVPATTIEYWFTSCSDTAFVKMYLRSAMRYVLSDLFPEAFKVVRNVLKSDVYSKERDRMALSVMKSMKEIATILAASEKASPAATPGGVKPINIEKMFVVHGSMRPEELSARSGALLKHVEKRLGAVDVAPGAPDKVPDYVHAEDAKIVEAT